MKDIESLLKQMTVPEKIAQMMQISYADISKEEAFTWVERGAGSFLHVLGNNARELQASALRTRLGIPMLFGIDAIHGHGLNMNAAIFPSQLALACAWDRNLVHKVGRVTAREVAADGLHWTFSPVLCLGRDMRWGRIDETFGEDTYLAGELGAALVKGYQGNDLSDDDSILACAKHYIGYGESTGARDAVDTEMTFRKLIDTFLPPFEKAVKAGCATIMTAYSSIDGTPFTICKKSLRTILKEKLRFNGFIITDWNNVGNLVQRQFVAENMQEAALLAINAGNDMIMTTNEFYEAALLLHGEGLLNMEAVDDAVRRILRIKARMNLFEKPEKKVSTDVIGCKEHLEAALTAARESVVLLENRNNILPLSTAGSIAVIGSNADDIRAQYGDWVYFTHPKPKDIEPVPPYHTLLSGIIETASEAEILYHRGCDVMDESEKDIEGAVSTARNCDVIIFAVGDVYAQHGEFKDRADLSLSGAQSELFDELKKLGKPIITVLIASKPLCLEQVAEKSDALITNFNGGQYGGLAIAEAIFGKFNPGGRLPISFPRHSGQMPVYYNQLPGWHGGKYFDLPETPLYPFGYGLSYTQFKYSGLEADAETLKVNVTIENIGKREGSEVVQLYINDVVSSVITPMKQLIAFKKIKLGAGEKRTIIFELNRMDFSLVNTDEQRVIEPGKFEIMVGGSSENASLLKTEIILIEKRLDKRVKLC